MYIKKLFLALLFALMLVPSLAVEAWAIHRAETEDSYLQGSITTLLRVKYAENANVKVVDGHVYFPESLSKNPKYEEILSEVTKLYGVESITLIDGESAAQLGRVWVLSGDTLFGDLYADTKWPRFSVSYHRITQNVPLRNTLDISLGKSFSLLKTGIGSSTLVEVGFQAAAFTNTHVSRRDFNGNVVHKSPEITFYNTDYYAALPVTLNIGPAFFQARVYYDATHVGFAGAEDPEYEGVDLLAAFDPTRWFRLYGGAGYVINREDTDMGRFIYQMGFQAQVESDYVAVPTTILALDVKGMSTNDCKPSWSAVIGLEAATDTYINLEFYDGYTPYGLLEKERRQWIGIGISHY